MTKKKYDMGSEKYKNRWKRLGIKILTRDEANKFGGEVYSLVNYRDVRSTLYFAVETDDEVTSFIKTRTDKDSAIISLINDQNRLRNVDTIVRDFANTPMSVDLKCSKTGVALARLDIEAGGGCDYHAAKLSERRTRHYPANRVIKGNNAKIGARRVSAIAIVDSKVVMKVGSRIWRFSTTSQSTTKIKHVVSGRRLNSDLFQDIDAEWKQFLARKNGDE